MGALQADASYVETEELACSCASLVPWASNSTVLMAQAEMPLLVSSQGSDVSSCRCIYHTRTSPSSSSTARPRVHKQTLSPMLCRALFFIIKVTPKGGSLHQKACVSCCSWFVARRPQQAISLHASRPTENLLSAPLLPQTAFTHQIPQTCP